MSQAGAGAGVLATQCLRWKLYDGEAWRQNRLPQAWANDSCLEYEDKQDAEGSKGPN